MIMNNVVIFAGGIGSRFGSIMPKQFLEINNVPIIIYTIKKFEELDEINEIVVVCKEEWIDYLSTKIKQFEIKKVVAILQGGATAFQSIFCGVNYFKQKYEDCRLLIHDGVRPLISTESIRNNINIAKTFGNAISYVNATETIFDNAILNRATCKMLRAPQTFNMNELYESFKKAMQSGKIFIDCASLMSNYGYTLYFSECNANNIKITTDIDFKICKLYLE